MHQRSTTCPTDPTLCKSRELTVIYVIGVEKLKGKKHTDVGQKHELL